MLAYNFGPGHPLKPERLRRSIQLLEQFGVQSEDPGPGEKRDAIRVHSPEYVSIVERADNMTLDQLWNYGFSSGDTPPFTGMFEASMAYLSGSVRAAERINDGERLTYNLAGGLHHAQRSKASGFCIFNDCAAALHVLKERYERVAYVDIDVHHGDGVQWIYWDDPTVLTCSIHQDGRTIYPGTGSIRETGANFSALNVPLWPETSGDVWLWAFRAGVLPVLDRFKPQAIVLQMGTDSHAKDPLARLNNTAQEWLEAVKDIVSLGLPVVALGGGGYEITCVPRMWTAACLSLAEEPIPEQIPEPFSTDWSMPFFFDPEPVDLREQGSMHAESVVQEIVKVFGL